MPLLRKQPFVRAVPPPGLQPETEVFHYEPTNEVFTEFEAFFERTILCDSPVWSCAVTGKSGLTYKEAAESEARSRKKIRGIQGGGRKRRRTTGLEEKVRVVLTFQDDTHEVRRCQLLIQVV